MLESTPIAYDNAMAGTNFYDVVSEVTTNIAPPIFLQCWQVVMHWKLIIIGLILNALPTGLGATLLATLQYSAKSRIEISRDKKKVLSLLSNAPNIEEEDALKQLRGAKSILSEAYLRIRSNLTFSTDYGVQRALMVISNYNNSIKGLTT